MSEISRGGGGSEVGDFLLLIIATGWVIGFFPALFTSIALVILKIKIVRKMDYIKVFLIGFIATFLCFIIPATIHTLVNIADIGNKLNKETLTVIFIYLIVSFIGGISSTILAKFILPKS